MPPQQNNRRRIGRSHRLSNMNVAERNAQVDRMLVVRLAAGMYDVIDELLRRRENSSITRMAQMHVFRAADHEMFKFVKGTAKSAARRMNVFRVRNSALVRRWAGYAEPHVKELMQNACFVAHAATMPLQAAFKLSAIMGGGRVCYTNSTLVTAIKGAGRSLAEPLIHLFKHFPHLLHHMLQHAPFGRPLLEAVRVEDIIQVCIQHQQLVARFISGEDVSIRPFVLDLVRRADLCVLDAWMLRAQDIMGYSRQRPSVLCA